MKIKYRFVTGEVVEIELPDDDRIAVEIVDSRRKEASAERKHRRHRYSLEKAVEEGMEPSDDTDYVIENEEHKRIHSAFETLTNIQKERILMVADGYTPAEIARIEGRYRNAIDESLKAGRKNFEKNF